MKARSGYQPCKISFARANELRAEISHFQTEYCAVLDANEVELWPQFFTSDACYRVTSRENVALGLPVGLVYCQGQAMMVDRAVAIARTQMFAPRYMLHILGATHIEDETAGGILSSTPFVLVQTLVEGASTVHLAGTFSDRFVRSGDRLLLGDRQVIHDTEILANDLVYPV
jgi:anthranilate 1,2-dioxygenase small subunit